MTATAKFQLALLGTLASLGWQSAAQAQATAHAEVVAGHASHPNGGQFDCATSSALPGKTTSFFNGSLFIPVEGYAYCGLSGGVQDVTGATSSGLAHESTTANFNSGSATLTADAKATIGSLSAKVSGTNTAFFGGGFDYAGAEAAAFSDDMVTFAGSGTQIMRFTFSIDGLASITGNGFVQTLLNYQINGGSIFQAFSGGASGNQLGHAANPTGNTTDPIPGFVGGLGSISGSGSVVSFDTPITLGVGTSFKLGLYVSAFPGALGGSASNDFFSTAKLSAIGVVDSSGALTGASVSGVGTSGFLYDSTGAHDPGLTSVPEPGTWALMILGLGCAGAALRRRPARGFARLAAHNPA